MNRDIFEALVWQHWADRHTCTVAHLTQPGIDLLPEEDFAGSGGIHTWHIARRAFVRYDPVHQSSVEAMLRGLGSPISLELGQLIAAASRMDAPVDRTDIGWLSYLYPPDFRPHMVPIGYTIRQLTFADAQALTGLQAACQPDETEEAEVSVEDEIPFGCFAEDTLAAVATGFRQTGFMDIGVITHPEFRQKGLGQAVVSMLCDWCLRRDIMPQYRNAELNIASHRLAQRLGFVKMAYSEHIYLKSNTTA